MSANSLSIDNWIEVFANWDKFVIGMSNTILISICGLVFAIFIGALVSCVFIKKIKALYGCCLVYGSICKNTPLAIQVFVLYGILPRVGISINVFLIGVISLGLHSGIYIADIFVAAVSSIHSGQIETAECQGFSFLQTMLYVIIPQAVLIALPPTTNQLILLVKDSAVLAIVAGGELMNVLYSFMGRTLIYAPPFIIVALMYLLVCLPLSVMSHILERKLKHG